MRSCPVAFRRLPQSLAGVPTQSIRLTRAFPHASSFCDSKWHQGLCRRHQSYNAASVACVAHALALTLCLILHIYDFGAQLSWQS